MWKFPWKKPLFHSKFIGNIRKSKKSVISMVIFPRGNNGFFIQNLNASSEKVEIRYFHVSDFP
jgi:hypothetical protein